MGNAFSVCLGEFYPERKTEIPPATNVIKAGNNDEGIDSRACFGAGCYWGTEKYFKDFASKSQIEGSITKGYVGFRGTKSSPRNPRYEDVCTGTTGHVEVYEFEMKGGCPFYEAMVRAFFQFHDPTTMNKQGNDAG